MPKDPIKAKATREKMRQAQQRRVSDPAERERRRRVASDIMKDSKNRQRISESIKKKYESDEQYREKVKKAMEKRSENPKWKEMMVERNKRMGEQNKGRKRTNETKEKQKQSALLSWSKLTPEERKDRSKAAVEYHRTDEGRHKLSTNAKKQWGDPEFKRKISACIKQAYTYEMRLNTVERNVGGFWYGSVPGELPVYCELWTEELRERVREYFGRVCIECGQPEGEEKLQVHHVWYDKKICCNDNPRRALVPLCRSCHMKTTHKKNREYWSNRFQEMIDTYYGGKCWLTKEEHDKIKQTFITN